MNLAKSFCHSRARWLAPLLVLAAYALVCLLTAPGDLWYPEWDSALYLLTAKSIAAGEGYTYLGEPFHLRPPGLSWILSFFAGGDGYDFRGLNLLFRVFAAASVIAVYFALRLPRPKQGAPAAGPPAAGQWLALAAAVLAGTSPLFVANFNFILSELPFAAALFGAIAFLRAAEAQTGRRWLAFALAGGVLLAGALYLRTIGIVLLPGIVLVGFFRERGREKRPPTSSFCTATARRCSGRTPATPNLRR